MTVSASVLPAWMQRDSVRVHKRAREREVDFFELSSPHGEQDDPRCAGSGGRTPGCRRLLGASGQPGAACAPLGKQDAGSCSAGPASPGGG